MQKSNFVIAAALLALASPAAVYAQTYGRPLALRNVGIDQKLNQRIPLNLTFTDEYNHQVTLSQYFKPNRPVVLSLVYYSCPMLCPLVLQAEMESLRNTGLKLGTDFEAVTVSFDPKETPQIALTRKLMYVNKYGRWGADKGWHFLTGKEPEIHALAEAVGFHYAWDPRTNQWAHASGIMVLTPDGRLSRYFYGISYPHREMRLGLVEASANKIGNPVDQLLLCCYRYDPTTGKYYFAVSNALRAGGAATVLGLGFLLFTMIRREKRSKHNV
jgi:protein SCO1